MKITNLILPIMALTTLGNNNPNNNQATIQFEKEISISSYEISPKDYLINQQDIFGEIGSVKTPTSHSEASCEAIYQSIMNTCNALTGAQKAACQIAAYSSYLLCLGVPGGASESI